MSGISTTMRLAFLLITAIGAGFGIGHLPHGQRRIAVVMAIGLIVVMMTGCASFSERDAINVGEGAWQGALLVDGLQTIHGPAQDPCYFEEDPITRRVIGRKPSEAGVVALFSVYSVLHFGIRQALLDTGHEHWASAFELLSVVQELRVDAHNVSMGIRLGAPNLVQMRSPQAAPPTTAILPHPHLHPPGAEVCR